MVSIYVYHRVNFIVIIKLLFTALNPLYLESLSVLITVPLVTTASRNSWREHLRLQDELLQKVT